jgi:hypothetical protein
MANAIMETLLETSTNANLDISTDEIVQASVDTSGVFMVDQYQLKRICTKTDNQLKAIMEAHLEDLAEYNTKLAKMKARVDEIQDDMKEEYLFQVENLDNMRNMFAVKYGELKEPSGDAWDNLKVTTEEAWSELEFY